MLGNRDKGQQMVQKIERRYLPLFPGEEKNPNGDRTRTPSPQEGKDRRVEEKKTQRVKTTGVIGDTIFYSQSES